MPQACQLRKYEPHPVGALRSAGQLSYHLLVDFRLCVHKVDKIRISHELRSRFAARAHNVRELLTTVGGYALSCLASPGCLLSVCKLVELFGRAFTCAKCIIQSMMVSWQNESDENVQ